MTMMMMIGCNYYNNNIHSYWPMYRIRYCHAEAVKNCRRPKKSVSPTIILEKNNHIIFELNNRNTTTFIQCPIYCVATKQHSKKSKTIECNPLRLENRFFHLLCSADLYVPHTFYIGRNYIRHKWL
jgi:hypothetical protein